MAENTTDDSKVRISMEAVNRTEKDIASVRTSLNQLDQAQTQSAAATENLKRSHEAAGGALVQTKEKVHELGRAFLTTERTITHGAAAVYALVEAYHVVVEAIELYKAKQEELETHEGAVEGQKKLKESILSTIEALEQQGKISEASGNVMKKNLDDAGDDLLKIRQVSQQLIKEQGGGLGFIPGADLFKAQYDLEKQIEDQRFEDLKARNLLSEFTIQKHFDRLHEIQEREFATNNNLAIGSANEENSRRILSINNKIADIAHEKALTKELNEFKAAQNKEAEQLQTDFHAGFEKRRAEATEKAAGADKEFKGEQLRIQKEIEDGTLSTFMAEDQTATAAERYAAALDVSIEKLKQIKPQLDDQLAVENEIADLENRKAQSQEVVRAAQDRSRKIIADNVNKNVQIERQERQLAQRKQQIQQDDLNSTASLLGSAAEVAKKFGKEGFLAWKAFALAQAIVSGAAAVLLQLGGGDPYSAVFRAAAAAAVAAVQIATIAATTPQGYAGGGLIPGTPVHHDNQIAMVGSGEYVIPTSVVQRWGAAHFETYRRGGDPAQDGPTPVVMNYGPAFADGGLIGSLGSATSQAETALHVNVGFLDSRSDMRRFMQREGTKIAVDQMRRRGNRLTG